jgi:hypothetical protein
MNVRSAVLLDNGMNLELIFTSRAVNCSEIARGKDNGGDDAVEVGVFARPISLTALRVGGKRAGSTIRKPIIELTEHYADPRTLWADAAYGTLDIATSTLEIRGKFHARGCGTRANHL